MSYSTFSAPIRAWLWLTAILSACIALYWSALRGPFLFDDFPNLAALNSVDHINGWRDLGIYLSQARDTPGRPLAMLSFLLQKQDWPDSPFPFKLVNLGLHLGCGFLVFFLTKRLSQCLERGAGTPPRPGTHELAALLAAAAWLLNPIAISGVLLVVQRMTLLMALFVLLGLLAYVKGIVRQDLPNARRGAWIIVGLGLCTALSFLSKENGILLPVYALVLDATLLRPSQTALPRPLQRLRRILIWPTVIFVLCYLAYAGLNAWGQSGIREFSLGERLLSEPRVLASYITNTFLPRFGVYGLYHDDFSISHGLFSPLSTFFCIVLLIGVLVLGFTSTKRHPLLAMGLLWYLGGQLIESSTVMLELYFEHRNYVPLIGAMMAIGIGITRLDAPGSRKFAQFVYGTWLAACCFATALSARVYASENLLATAWASAQPDSLRAQAYLADRLFQSGRAQEALRIIDGARAKHPRNAGLQANRVYLLCSLGVLSSNDMDVLDELLRKSSFDRTAFENMETLRNLATSNHCPALNSDRWKSTVDIMLSNPAFRDNAVSSGILHYQKHFWAVEHGDLNMAISELDATYRVDPDANIPRLQAKYLASAGLYDQAIRVLRDTDTSRLPMLRKLLVNDKAINDESIAQLKQMR